MNRKTIGVILVIVLAVGLGAWNFHELQVKLEQGQEEVRVAEEQARQAAVKLRNSVLSDLEKGIVYPPELSRDISETLDVCVSRGYIPNNPLKQETNSHPQPKEQFPPASEAKVKVLDVYYDTIYYVRYDRYSDRIIYQETYDQLHALFQTDNYPLTVKKARLNYLPTGLNIYLDVNVTLTGPEVREWVSKEFQSAKDLYGFDIHFEIDPSATIIRDTTNIYRFPKDLRQIVRPPNRTDEPVLELSPPDKSGRWGINLIRTVGPSGPAGLAKVELYSADNTLVGNLTMNISIYSTTTGLRFTSTPAYAIITSKSGTWKVPIASIIVKTLPLKD